MRRASRYGPQAVAQEFKNYCHLMTFAHDLGAGLPAAARNPARGHRLNC